MGKVKTNEEWLEGQLRFLSAWGEEVGPLAKDVRHEYGWHTALKLAALNHAIGVFSPVARGAVERGWATESIYVDLFAGSGANLLPSGDWIAGSPVIAGHAKKPFDRIICVESDASRKEALCERLRLTGTKALDVICGDCNTLVSEVSHLVNTRKPLIFLAVDPEGMEIHWETLRALAWQFKKMDFFINLTHGAQREFGAAIASDRASPSLQDLTGLSLSEILLDSNGNVPQAYTTRVREVLGKKYGETTTVRGESNQPVYHVMVYARQTRGDSPWRNAYGDIHRRLSTLTNDHIRGAMNLIKGRAIEGWSQPTPGSGGPHPDPDGERPKEH